MDYEYLIRTLFEENLSPDQRRSIAHAAGANGPLRAYEARLEALRMIEAHVHRPIIKERLMVCYGVSKATAYR
jgi:hypothetical protein